MERAALSMFDGTCVARVDFNRCYSNYVIPTTFKRSSALAIAQGGEGGRGTVETHIPKAFKVT
eukprot:1930292-Prymnesium_polylepis.1